VRTFAEVNTCLPLPLPADPNLPQYEHSRPAAVANEADLDRLTMDKGFNSLCLKNPQTAVIPLSIRKEIVVPPLNCLMFNTRPEPTNRPEAKHKTNTLVIVFIKQNSSRRQRKYFSSLAFF